MDICSGNTGGADSTSAFIQTRRAEIFQRWTVGRTVSIVLISQHCATFSMIPMNVLRSSGESKESILDPEYKCSIWKVVLHFYLAHRSFVHNKKKEQDEIYKL